MSEIVTFRGYGRVMILNETTSAIQVLLFGVVYLPSGFLGRLYTGFRLNQREIRVKLLTHLALPGVSGFSILFLAGFILGFLNLSVVDYAPDILFQLSGCVSGGCLGGYAMNCRSVESNNHYYLSPWIYEGIVRLLFRLWAFFHLNAYYSHTVMRICST